MSWRESLARASYGPLFRPAALLRMPDAAFSLRSLPVYDAGSYVTPEQAQRLSPVFGCIARITNAIAPHPWKVYEVNGRRREYRPDDAVGYLLNTRPNPHTTAVAFRQAMLRGCMAGDGNAYAEIQVDGAFRPVALWPIEPDRVVPHTDGGGNLYYQVSQYQGGVVDVDPSRIYHLRGLASVNGLVGDNTLYRASMAIAIGLSAQQYAASFYANGTVSSGVLKHPKSMKDATIKRLRAEWVQNQGGAKQHAPMFLEEGMEWQTIALDAEKSQLQESRAFVVEEVSRYFGVPLHLLGVAQSAQGYGTNVEQLGIEFVRYTLAPWAAALEQEADAKLFPPRQPWRSTKIDLSKLTHGDSKTQAEAYVVLKKGGILNQNQVLEEMGLNTVGPQGDVYMVESTMKTVDQIVNPPEPVAPKVLPPPAPGKPAPQEPDALVREAIAAIYAGALERYARKLANRRADLERNAPSKVEPNLSAERERARASACAECVVAERLLAKAGLPAPNGEFLTFLAAVEQGEPPTMAAERLVAHLEEK